tara:strand:+ start:61 stop:447 length:387 start_codon:yes stop_codon:yes gene_type:complete
MDEPTTKVCMMVECGGKEQPHSWDDSVGALDCDGPCSTRRVAHYHAKQQEADLRTELQAKTAGIANFGNRTVTLVPLGPDALRHQYARCQDCGRTAQTVVIETMGKLEDLRQLDSAHAWNWCGICQVG